MNHLMKLPYCLLDQIYYLSAVHYNTFQWPSTLDEI